MPQIGGSNPRTVEGYAVESAIRDGSIQRENAGWYAPGQSSSVMTGQYSVAASGSLAVPLLQVPAGKVFLVSDIWITANTNAQQKMTLGAGASVGSGVPLSYSTLKGDTAPIEMPGLESQLPVLPGQILWLTSDTCTGTTIFSITINGFQQNVGVG